MLHPRFRTLLIASGMLLVHLSSAAAQNSASASVLATVLAPLVVTKTTDLDFGVVLPGVNKTVAVTDVTAASFAIVGAPSTSINMSFTLPTNMTSSGNTLPVSSWTGRHNTTASSASGTDFTPSATATSTTLPVTLGTRYVYIGATVQPSTSQAAGVYSATMTLTVVYF